jgi:MoxR-like ATPase
MESMKEIPEETIRALRDVMAECQKTVVGKKDELEALLVGLLSEGHILLEGVPGVAKTTLAKTFAEVVGLDFRRIQGSADTLPADVVGTYIFDPAKSTFRMQKGPVFTNLLLIDEINRNSPKTNSAVLEAMQEAQVTISGETYDLPKPFMTIATQSPIEFHGVFPLPEVLVDRFLLSVNVDYPSASEEVEMTNRLFKSREGRGDPVITREKLFELIELTKKIYVAPNVQSYIVDIIQRSRRITGISLGGSPRASIALSRASRVNALLNNRAYVTPDDVKRFTPYVLRHRLIASTSVGTASTADLVKTLLEETPIPKRED